MTCYAQVINLLGLNSDSQGTAYDWLYLLLKVADTYESANPTPDELSNPFAETLRRLRNVADGHAVRKIGELFGGRLNASVYPWQAV
jgi:hypothetical protein